MFSSKALTLVAIPALLLFMTGTGGILNEAVAAIVISCNENTCGCSNKESCDKMKKGDWCKKDTISCDDKGTECGCTAARVVAPPTKVQPNLRPGGAEQPGTERPSVRPGGGVQRERY